MNWHPLYLFIYLFIKDDGLFGAEYVKMLNKYSISPDTRVPVKFVEARVVNKVLVVQPAVKIDFESCQKSIYVQFYNSDKRGN